MDGLASVRVRVGNIKQEDEQSHQQRKNEYQHFVNLGKSAIQVLKNILSVNRKLYKIDETLKELQDAFGATGVEERTSYQIGNGYHNLLTEDLKGIDLHHLGGYADELSLFVELTLQISSDIQRRGNNVSLGLTVRTNGDQGFWIRGWQVIPPENGSLGYTDHTVIKIELKKGEMNPDTIAAKALEAFEAKDN